MDPDFSIDHDGLMRAVQLLEQRPTPRDLSVLPSTLPQFGEGAGTALELLAPLIFGRAARLGKPTAFAHMDPPTPWVTWATALWNASLNQNLLHPATSPVARAVETRVVDWLAPYFGMEGGHMTSGSTLANLTALWAARECAGITEVVASESAHVSVAKAAHILGLRYRSVATTASGAMASEQLSGDLSRSALVLTAGATSTGAVDPLRLAGQARWTHVDAAWAGPLRLSAKYASVLDGIDQADSIAVSAHKWLFQPKESALIFFRDVSSAHGAISFDGAYLTVPNIGVQGSHGANAVPLLATLLAWGREGLVARIERCMEAAELLAATVLEMDGLELLEPPRTGVLVWRPKNPNVFDRVRRKLPSDLASTTTLLGESWFRHVAANPNVDIRNVAESIRTACRSF